MADTEARREARRRKILENSERRLKKITGVEEKNTKSELDGIRLNTPYESQTESALLGNNTSEILRQDVHNLQNNASCNSLELETIFHNPRSVANDSVSNCYVEVTESKNYRNILILLMPVILSFILVFSDLFEIDMKSFYLNKIFLPLITYEIVAYFFGPSVNTFPNLLNLVLLLTNIRNPFVLSLVEHFQSLLNIVQDAMIYFFVFTLSYWLLQVILI